MISHYLLLWQNYLKRNNMLGIIKIYFNYYLGELFNIRRKPRTLQFPITSRCNSRCVTCNIWKHQERMDVNPEELRKLFSSSFFTEVKDVGINGGEPTLHPNFIDVVKAVLTLPKLQNIALISNCINSDKLLYLLHEIYPACKEKGVFLHLQLSVDGIGDIHNEVRGVKISFERTMKTLNELYHHRVKYLDAFDIGCTISRQNVDYLVQLEEYFSDYDVPIYFHLAVPNKRIHNFNDAPFSVLNDKHATQMAKEFFLCRAFKACNRLEKIRSTLIYLYLAGKTHRRMFMCNYLYQDITLNENLDTFLCATASDKVGSFLDGVPSYNQYNRMINTTKKHCDTCIHYANLPNLRGLWTYFLYKLSTFNWLSKYKKSL